MRKEFLIIIFLLLFAFTASEIASAGNVMKGFELFKDSSLGTNGKSCNECHPKGSGIDGRKKSFTIMGKEQSSIEDAVNFCIQNALKGESLDKDSEKMENIVSYLKTLKGKIRKKKVIKGC
jgi:cytochrome c